MNGCFYMHKITSSISERWQLVQCKAHFLRACFCVCVLVCATHKIKIYQRAVLVFAYNVSYLVFGTWYTHSRKPKKKNRKQKREWKEKKGNSFYSWFRSYWIRKHLNLRRMRWFVAATSTFNALRSQINYMPNIPWWYLML